MALAAHHKLALGGAVLTSGIALADAVVHGLTGEWGPFSEEGGRPAVLVVGTVAHGLTYLGLALVLVREAPRFTTANVVARTTRWLLLGSLVVLAAAFLTVVPVTAASDVSGSVFYDASAAIAAAAFAALILGSAVLGLALLRSRALGIGARVLALMLPVLGLTLVLAWLAPDWAHPAYLETTLYVGLALLGAGSGSPGPVPRAPFASPTSAG